MKKIRYAVIGLGHIAQTAVLPAFKNAKESSELYALISRDPTKLKALSKKYKVPHSFSEDQFDECLKSCDFDVLYIAKPNTDHFKYAKKAAEHGKHVICEKPLTTSVEQCKQLNTTVTKNKIKFMVAYRLHFDPANLRAIEIAHSKQFGKIRLFNSVFSYQHGDRNNIRLQRNKGGGPLNDIGIYCINATRYLFKAEPIEVSALSATNPNDPRFKEVPEMLSVTMRFSEERLAQFTCSFGATDCSSYSVFGTQGTVTLDSAYDYAEPMELTSTLGEKTKTVKFKKHDQFAAELLYFSNCVLKNQNPQPSVLEGLNDLLVIQAIENSIKHKRPMTVEKYLEPKKRPSVQQKKMVLPPVLKSQITHVHVTNPSGTVD